MSGTNRGSRSLADDLRARTDEELAALLRLRPDLVVPVPVDIAQLASRAATRTSVVRALDRLDQLSLHVIDALVVLPDPTSADAVQSLLGVPARTVRTVLGALRERALTWGDRRKIHLVRAVGEIIGPHPAGLGPPARQLLTALPPSRLTTMTTDLGLPAKGDHAAHAELVAAHLGSAETLEVLLQSLSEEATAALRALVDGPPTGRVEEAWRDVSMANVRTPIDYLLATGLLIPVDGDAVVLPREVGLHLRGGVIRGSIQVTRPEPESASRDVESVDRAAAAGAFELVRKVEALLDAWAVDPPPVLRTGGLGLRDFRKLPARLDTDETGAALIAELAYASALVAPTDGADEVWLPTPAYDTWQREQVADRWAVLAESWLRSSRTAGLVGTRDDRDRLVGPLGGDLDRPVAPEIRRQVLDLLAGLPPGSAPERDGVVETVRWQRPRRGGRLRDDVVGWTLREAETLGVTGRGALASYARPLLGGGESAAASAALALTDHLPELLEHVLLQADLTAVAPGPLRPDVARELNLLADVESRGGASVYRFTAGSIRRALDAGRSADELHQFLLSASRTPVPQPLTYLVDDVARKHGLLRIGAAASFIRCDDHAVLAEILAAPQASALGVRRLAPTVLASSLDGLTLLERLRQMGFAPTPEDADGSIVVAPAQARRAPARPGPQPTLAERPAPTETVLGAAVRALRAGDRSATVRPPDAVPGRLGRSASAQMLADLRRALDDGVTIWIGYVDQHGSTSERVVDPVRLEGGWLAAFDHRSNEIRSFAVHRISGVAVVDA